MKPPTDLGTAPCGCRVVQGPPWWPNSNTPGPRYVNALCPAAVDLDFEAKNAHALAAVAQVDQEPDTQAPPGSS